MGQRNTLRVGLALLTMLGYFDRPSQAAQATAEGCKVVRSTVYRALSAMEQQVS